MMGAFKQMAIDFDFDNELPPNNVRQPTETQRLAKAWVNYAEANRLSPKTKKYHELHHAFLCGIGNALGEQTPTIISLCMVSGRDVASLVERTQPR